MVIEKKDTGIKIMERDRHRQLNEHAKEVNKHKKEMQLSRSLKKEVVAGANGTQKEHMEIAHACAKVIADIFPLAGDLV